MVSTSAAGLGNVILMGPSFSQIAQQHFGCVAFAAGRHRSRLDSTPLLVSELKVVEQGIDPRGVDVWIRR